MVRHGQDEDNAKGILNGRRNEPLTAKGIEQAHELAKKIKETGVHFDHIYVSPLQRAQKTAAIIVEALGAKSPETLEGLIEREFGVMAGKPQSSIKETCVPDILQTDTVCYFLHQEGAETFPELMDRAQKFLNDLREKHADGNILLVTHSDLGKMLYGAYYHFDWVTILKKFHFGNSEMLELSEESGPEDTHVFRFEQHNH